MSGRVPGIDVIRCIGACAVLLGHATQATTVIRPEWIARHEGVLNRIVTPVFGHLVHWGLGIFFVVSGFCIHLAAGRLGSGADELPARRFYQRRFVRIYPPQLVALTLAGAAAFLVPRGLFFAEWQQISVPTPFRVFVHLLMIHSFFPSARTSIHGALWTLALEAQFYLTYPLLRRTLRAVRGESVVAFLFVLSIGSTYLVSLVEPGYAHVWDENFVGRYWEWVLGVVVAERMLTKPVLSGSGWLYFATLLLVSYLFSLATDFLPQGRALLMHVRPFLFGLAVNAGARLPPLRSTLYRWALALGFRSYSLYLVHPIGISLACVGLAALGAPLAAQWIAAIALSLGAAFLFFRVVERPFMQRAARTSASLPPATVEGATG